MAMEVRSPSYEELVRLVDGGSVRIVFVLGLARGGTTALEKLLYEKLEFAAQINEPSLLGPPPSAGVSRVEMTFARVLEHVETGTVLVKEVTNKVLPEMVPLWQRLSELVLVVVRNPLLQFESRLKSMLDRIDSGALRDDFGIHAAMPAASKVHGEPLFHEEEDEEESESSSESSTSKSTSESPSWAEAYAVCKRNRDFSALGLGALRACLLHPFCQWRESQRAMFAEEALPADGPGEEDALPLSRFAELDAELARRIFQWRLGWRPLERQVAALSRYQVVDFSDVQVDGGEAVVTKLQTALGLPRRTTQVAFETCANKGDWSREKWEQWYAAPCFERVERSSELEPPAKTPIAATRLPAFASAELRSAIDLWLRLLPSDVVASSSSSYRGVDELHDAVRVRTKAMTFADVSARCPHLFPPKHKSRTVFFLAGVCLTQLAFLAQCLAVVVCSSRIFGGLFRRPPQKEEENLGSSVSSSDTSLLSVVIPAHNEAATIGTTIEKARSRAVGRVEVIVVDGGSDDATVERARHSGVSKVVRTVGGRGAALKAGAQAATGAALLFLHADTFLPEHYDEHVRRALQDPNILMCAFSLRFSGGQREPLLNVIAAAANFRAKVLRLPFGDQALALSRRNFEMLGGFTDTLPILEDLDFVLRARSHASRAGQRIALLPHRVVTSPRRYLRAGLLRANLLNASLLFSWQLGLSSPQSLFRAYYS